MKARKIVIVTIAFLMLLTSCSENDEVIIKDSQTVFGIFKVLEDGKTVEMNGTINSSSLVNFNKLYQNVETPISKSRGAYWAARASEALGDNATAQTWYKAAAIYPTVFYGQMALDKIGQEPRYGGQPDKGASLEQVVNWPKVRAARLLYKAGLNSC